MIPLLESLHIATLDAAVHLIQVALTPVFLLSGIAALLNVYAARLARVADRLQTLADLIATCSDAQRPEIHDEIAQLHRRSLAMDTAVVLATIAAAATCLAILMLFVQALSRTLVAGILVAFFGTAIICTLGSIAGFGAEMLISSRGLRGRMLFHVPHLRHRRL